MVDILHRIGVGGSTTKDVYEALTSPEALARWWTQDTSGDGDAGGVLEFRFPPVGGFDMAVVDATPGEHVTWRVTDGPEEWVGTTVEWELRQDADYAIVLFTHAGWAEPVEFMHHCSTKWATFLMSLKALLETGEGAPAPNDVPVSDWH